VALQVDDLLQGRYRIVRAIKSGGMGAVFEATDTKLADSPCAVKEVLEHARSGGDSAYVQARFYEEMKALARLDHPCIPKVRDYITAPGEIYIVMELVRGKSLEDELDDYIALAGSPPPPETVVNDMLQLLDTLAYLHGFKPPIIHRDVKPANVVRDARLGGIKLVDFGLARSLDQQEQPAQQTLVGTLGYVAPEQMMGRADVGSDLYSVAMTMCHLLTGKVPAVSLYQAQSPDLPPNCARLSAIIERATQPKIEERYLSAIEMIRPLREWLDERRTAQAAALPPTLPQPRPWAPSTSRPSASPEAVVVHPVALEVAIPTHRIPASASGYARTGAMILALCLVGGVFAGVYAGKTPAAPTPTPTEAVRRALPLHSPEVPTATSTSEPTGQKLEGADDYSSFKRSRARPAEARHVARSAEDPRGPTIPQVVTPAMPEADDVPEGRRMTPVRPQEFRKRWQRRRGVNRPGSNRTKQINRRERRLRGWQVGE
jgi:serine/threonine protein kinase